MDLDDPAQRATRRTSAAHDRPSRAPSGPRIRTRPKHSVDTPSSPSPPGDVPASPPFSSTASSPGVHSRLSSLSTHRDAGVQATPPPTPSPSPAPPAAPQKSVAATFTAPPPLTPPPTVSFDSTPIPWKGLPLEAAQWTFSSSELQEIVSNAIRLSARESFVRLLSLQALEVDIVQETERLSTERVASQAKWRFEVGRRTMLMQALNSSAASSVPSGNSNENESRNTITGFVGQLASSIASCDSLLSSILHFSDQQSQIALIQYQHWASALGIALNKLNKAYERQGQELMRAQARVQTLEDELEEAWREAEKMAIEFDGFEEEVAASTDDGSDGIDMPAEGVIDTGADENEGPPPETRLDPDETGTLGDTTINAEVAVVLGVTATAVASKATLVTSPGSPKSTDKSDTKSIRSIKSTRSRRSTRDGPNHASRLSAARLRSRAASNASLRLPKALRSAPSTHTTPAGAPPIPALPQGHSFLDMSNVAHEQVRKATPPRRYPEPTFALPTPPQSAGLPPTRVPSIWVETDGGESTRLNGLDRTHSLQIFSSLMSRTPRKARRSNLVMSLTRSDRSSGGSLVDGPSSSGSNTGVGVVTAASPTSNSSPVSLPAHALTHFRGPSVSSQSNNGTAPRPGSAGARLTTTIDTRTPVPVATPRRSLVSRASSVILRRLSQATTGGSRSGSGNTKGVSLTSPSRSREALRLSGSGRTLERWREGQEEEGEGEVMLIGSPHADPFDAS